MCLKTCNPKKDGDLHVSSKDLFAKAAGIFKRPLCFTEQKYRRSIVYNSFGISLSLLASKTILCYDKVTIFMLF